MGGKIDLSKPKRFHLMEFLIIFLVIALVGSCLYIYKIRKDISFFSQKKTIVQSGIDQNLFDVAQSQKKEKPKKRFSINTIKEKIADNYRKKKQEETSGLTNTHFTNPNIQFKNNSSNIQLHNNTTNDIATNNTTAKKRLKPATLTDKKPTEFKFQIFKSQVPKQEEKKDFRQREIDQFNKRRTQGQLQTEQLTINIDANKAKVQKEQHIEKTAIEKPLHWKEEPVTNASYPHDMTRVILEGHYISAKLIEEINSSISGIVRALIESNVYGQEGRFVLIPAGSTAIGKYKAVSKAGQERIVIMWHRIVTPNGINIHVGNAEMTDEMGRSGITGIVDRKLTKRYGMTFLISLLSAVAALSTDVDNEYQAAAVEAFSKNILDITKDILRENLSANKPVIHVRAGSRIFIRPVKDIFFPPAANKEVTILSKKLAKKGD